MAANFDLPPLTEPVITPCLYVTGIEVVAEPGVIRLVGWVQLPSIGGETEERRIVLRAVLPTAAARTVAAEMRKALAAGGH